MYTVRKTYDEVEFLHRVSLRDGRPSYVHGHAWKFEFVFAAPSLNVNGFVLDFDDLVPLERAVDKLRDCLVLSREDPDIARLSSLPDLFEISEVPDASSEGLASYFYTIATQLLPQGSLARCVSCTVTESASNSATFADPAW